MILLFAILNGTDSWLKLDQMTSTLTCNLVKMDNLGVHLILVLPVMDFIFFTGLIIECLVLLNTLRGTFGREHLLLNTLRGTFGREHLVTRRLILRLNTVVHCLLCLFAIIYVMSMIINGSTFDGFYFSLSTLEKPTMLSLDSYSAYPEVAKSWDQLQVGNKCCGVHNYSDWFGLSLLGHFYDSYKLESPNGVPDSCCKQLTVGCGRNVTITNLENIYPTGCLKYLGVHIEKQIFEWMFKWLLGCFVVMLIHTYIDHRFRREYGSLLAFIDKYGVLISRAHDWMAKRAIIASNGKDKRRSYNRNNDIENTPLIEESVSDDHEIDIEDEGVNTDGLINIRDDEENEYNGNEGGSVGTTVIHTPDVHRDACTYSDDHT